MWHHARSGPSGARALMMDYTAADWDLAALPTVPAHQQGGSVAIKFRTESGRAAIVRPSGCTSIVCGWRMCMQGACHAFPGEPLLACGEHRLQGMAPNLRSMRSRHMTTAPKQPLPPGRDPVDALISTAAAADTARWVEIERAGADAKARWALNRRIGWGKVRCGKGGAEGSRTALYENQGVLTMVCVFCAALVDKGSATRAAQKAARVEFAPGDGCASAMCVTSRFRAARFHGRQAKMRAQLRKTERVVVRWPRFVRDEKLFVLPLQLER